MHYFTQKVVYLFVNNQLPKILFLQFLRLNFIPAKSTLSNCNFYKIIISINIVRLKVYR